MKTKVLQIITSLDDGGAETLVKDYAILLNRGEYEVKIVVIHNVKNTANYTRVISEDVEVIPVYYNYNLISRIGKKLFGKSYIPQKIRKIVQLEKPDAVHIHLANLQYIAPISEALTGCKLFYTCHNLPSLMLQGERQSEYEAAKKLIRNNNLQMIALHQEMADEINELMGINNTLVIRNGVDFNRFRNLKTTSNNKRREINIPKNAFIVGHIGRFTDQKNHEFLIDVFREVKIRKNNAYLILVGNGELETEIRNKVKKYELDDCVMFLSHRTDIPELLSIMDVFLFPSKYEGLSVTLVEAQVAGKKCVVSDKINLETVLSEKTRLLSLDENLDVWASATIEEGYINPSHGDISKFDMNEELRNLGNMYEK